MFVKGFVSNTAIFSFYKRIRVNNGTYTVVNWTYPQWKLIATVHWRVRP